MSANTTQQHKFSISHPLEDPPNLLQIFALETQ